MDQLEKDDLLQCLLFDINCIKMNSQIILLIVYKTDHKNYIFYLNFLLFPVIWTVTQLRNFSALHVREQQLLEPNILVYISDQYLSHVIVTLHV